MRNNRYYNSMIVNNYEEALEQNKIAVVCSYIEHCYMVNNYEEALKLIEQLEADDRKEGIYEEDAYKIIDK